MNKNNLIILSFFVITLFIGCQRQDNNILNSAYMQDEEYDNYDKEVNGLIYDEESTGQNENQEIISSISLVIHSQSFANIPDNNFYIQPPTDVYNFLLNNTIMYSTHEPERIEKTGQYIIDMTSGIPFIDVVWEDNNIERMMIISNESICNIFTTSGWIFGGTSRNQGAEIWVYPIADTISASSHLVEGSVSYAPEQRGRPLYQPLWVEGVEGHGINEKLFITAKACFALHISIGYVSYVNPNLYKENSRPKLIRLTVENEFTFDVELEDTPNYQTIMLPFPLRENDILELEILDVYPGTRYSDTCINEIFYDYIPWRP